MIESLLRLSIDRRWLMMCLGLILVGIGLWSYQKLPIDVVPDITNVQVQINTRADGYSPLETEQRITYPIENALMGMPNLAYTRSLSRYGLSQVTVVFDEGTDLYFARNLVNERLSAIDASIPNGLQPQMAPLSTGLGEIFMYTIEAMPDARQPNGAAYDATALREIQDWIIKPQLAQVDGVTEINSIGGYDKQYHITPDPQKMLAYEVSFADIKQALQANNSNRGAGYIERGGQQLTVRSAAQLQSMDEVAQVIVKYFGDTPVFISDVAEVAIGKALRTGAATRDGRETVLGSAMMLVGENSRQVSLALAAKLEAVKASLPNGIKVEAVYDRSDLVDKAMATVQKTSLKGLCLLLRYCLCCWAMYVRH